MQERLGHSTITTTMDLYSHVSETMQSDATARLDQANQPDYGMAALALVVGDHFGDHLTNREWEDEIM